MEHTTSDQSFEPRETVLSGPAVSPRRRSGASPLGWLSELPPPFARVRSTDALPTLEPTGTGIPGDAGSEGRASGQAPEGLEVTATEEDLGLVRGIDWDLPDEETEPAIEPTVPDRVEAGEDVPRTESPVGEVDAWNRRALPEPETAAFSRASTEVLEEWSLVASGGAGESTEGEIGDGEGEDKTRVAGEEVEPPTPPAPRMEAALAEAMGESEGPALEEVAGRLERIALALREGRPIELFASGASDPLEVLIAGYALGYSEAFRRVSEDRRTGP